MVSSVLPGAISMKIRAPHDGPDIAPVDSCMYNNILSVMDPNYAQFELKLIPYQMIYRNVIDAIAWFSVIRKSCLVDFIRSFNFSHFVMRVE